MHGIIVLIQGALGGKISVTKAAMETVLCPLVLVPSCWSAELVVAVSAFVVWVLGLLVFISSL